MILKQITEEQMERTKNILLNYPWEDPVAYGMWLAQTYYMVCHSTRLVALAGAYVPVGNEGLHGRFIDHSKEERGHQLICISDIKKLGYQLTDFPQIYQSQAMYQVQYYWIQHQKPASFFGYTLALEVLAEKFGQIIWERTCKAHGKEASRFLHVHSVADVGHTEEAYKYILQLSPAETAAAVENLKLSCDLYRGMLLESQEISKSLLRIKKSA